MARLDERCPQCRRRLFFTRFDARFRMPDRTERTCFSVPAGLCRDCEELYLEPGLVDLLNLAAGRCVFAIESDSVMRARATSAAD